MAEAAAVVVAVSHLPLYELELMLILSLCRLSAAVRYKYWFISAFTDRQFLEYDYFCSIVRFWFRSEQHWQWQGFYYEQTNNYLSHLI
jgi:hypothetical protein